MERMTGIEPVLPTCEGQFSVLYFQHLQNRSRKMYVHALHTVQAVSEMRVSAGRLRETVCQY
jgi:chromosome condensin MukBEF ATPase and DNA-binding subunit MukB